MREGVSAYPPGWGPDQIGRATAQALQDAAAREGVGSAAGLSTHKGHEALVSVDGRRVVVRVHLGYDGDKVIATSHPVRGDGVVQVINGRLVSRPLRADE